MKIEESKVQIFKMRNRNGYAAICQECLTEGKTKEEAYGRMVKALKRVNKK